MRVSSVLNENTFSALEFQQKLEKEQKISPTKNAMIPTKIYCHQLTSPACSSITSFIELTLPLLAAANK
jgi:hypothetical protein